MLKPCNNKVFIHPGQFCFSDQACHIHTLLGSCIAITLWHPQKKIGGMCHFVLPTRSSTDNSASPNGRYADEAMELFRREVSARGAKFSEFESKVFGGSNLIESDATSSDKTIGLRNAETAMTLLTSANAQILVMHVGEYGHRRVIFDTSNGDVWVKFENTTVAGKKSTMGLS